MSNKFALLGAAACAFFASACLAQNAGINSVPGMPSDAHGKYEVIHPLNSKAPNFTTAVNSGSDVKNKPNALAGVTSIPNFARSFNADGYNWPYAMVGHDPIYGGTTTVPTRIVAVSLELQNSDLVSTTTVPVANFVRPTLNSPNFQASNNFTSGYQLQFADAVQRAEFWNSMKQNWHTDLYPTSVVDKITVPVPYFETVTLNGSPTQVRTYYKGTAPDGSTFVLLEEGFFNDQIFTLVNSEINANHYSTKAMNIALFPNTYLFGLDSSGGIGGCCVLGYHTYFYDPSQNPLPVWMFAYASWISPGLFNGGFQDVTALSHEISETFNDPFLFNQVPAWQFPGTPAGTTCQDNLETGDPLEVLADATVSTPIKAQGSTFTYHPQTEALLQWFEGIVPSDALGGAYSYPNTSALTQPATPYGPLTCP